MSYFRILQCHTVIIHCLSPWNSYSLGAYLIFGFSVASGSHNAGHLVGTHSWLLLEWRSDSMLVCLYIFASYALCLNISSTQWICVSLFFSRAHTVMLLSKLLCPDPWESPLASYISVGLCMLWKLSLSFRKLGNKFEYKREESGCPRLPLLPSPGGNLS